MMELDRLGRIPLAVLPTPLQEAPRLAEALGIPKLYIKRDDCTGLATGGNKARKLEFLMADARNRGADLILTAGGVQSNHARQTAAAAAKLGMDSVLFLNDPRPDHFPGNLLLDILFNAGLTFCPGVSGADLILEMERYGEAMRAKGKTAYVIPVGGSNAMGAAGYVNAMREVAEQCREMGIDSPQIFMANGSGGTQAGLTVGAEAFLPGASIHGVSVGGKADAVREGVFGVIKDLIRLLKVNSHVKLDDLVVHDEYVGPGYAIATKEGLDAIRLAARTEALLLDPVYTGKAMAGLIDMARRKMLDPGRPVIFWHTGGHAGLLAVPELFEGEAQIIP